MRDLLKKFNYKQDHQTSLFLILIIAGIFFLNLILELYYKRLSFIECLLIGIPVGYLFKYYYNSLKSLHYTFWGLSLAVVPLQTYYFVTSMIRNTYPHQSTLFLLSFIFLILVLYFSSSPVYYPKVSWWEFDYRYRADIDSKIIFNEKEHQGKLTDVRRRGGSIASFEDLKLGDRLNLNFSIKDKEFNVDSIVGSKSQSIIGRPYSYGIKFHIKSKEDKENYKILHAHWREKENLKMNQKFEKDNS